MSEGEAGAPSPGEFFAFAPDPEAAGWYAAPQATTGRFIDLLGAVRMRREGETSARIRLTPEERHQNVIGTVHGGFVMAIVDQALFLGPAVLGMRRVRGATTIESSTQFFGPLQADRPLDVVVEVLRETGRMVFLRGIVEQDGVACVSFQGTIRKASA